MHWSVRPTSSTTVYVDWPQLQYVASCCCCCAPALGLESSVQLPWSLWQELPWKKAIVASWSHVGVALQIGTCHTSLHQQRLRARLQASPKLS